MTAPRDFLVALAQGLASRRLYGPAHPRSRMAVSHVVDCAVRLLEDGLSTRFTLLGTEVIHGNSPLRGAVPSEWTARLSEVGVQRIELRGRPAEAHVDAFLEGLESALREGSVAAAADVASGEEEGGEAPTIAWGPVRPRDEIETRARADAAPDAGPAEEEPPDLTEELGGVAWIWDRVRAGDALPMAEAEAVVRSLAVTTRRLPPGHAPRIPPGPGLHYPHLHALHTAAMTLAWARVLELSPAEAFELGMAALLHDVGFVLSDEGSLLDRPGELDAEGRKVVEAHPGAGGQLLLEASASLALPAIVAFEHHLTPSGGGYPAAAGGRRPHPAAQLVQLLSSYDALRSDRPYRAALPPAEARETLAVAVDEGAFSADLLVQFSRMWFEAPGRATAPEGP
jgi:hypothetical protein